MQIFIDSKINFRYTQKFKMPTKLPNECYYMLCCHACLCIFYLHTYARTHFFPFCFCKYTNVYDKRYHMNIEYLRQPSVYLIHRVSHILKLKLFIKSIDWGLRLRATHGLISCVTERAERRKIRKTTRIKEKENLHIFPYFF